MANSSSIPPLLCNTPPPMDDGGCFEDDDDDDISMAESIGDDNTPSASAHGQPTTPPLPTDDHNDLPVAAAAQHRQTHAAAAATDATVPPRLVPSDRPPAADEEAAPPLASTVIDLNTTTPDVKAPDSCARTLSASSPVVVDNTAQDFDEGIESPPPLDDDDDDNNDDTDVKDRIDSIGSSTPPIVVTVPSSSPRTSLRCDSPPSLDFHDPPSFAGDDVGPDDDDFDGDGGAVDASLSTASSMPSLQLSAAVTLQSPIGDPDPIGQLHAEQHHRHADIQLEELPPDDDDDAAATSPCSASALDLSDSFEDFVEYDAAVVEEPSTFAADFGGESMEPEAETNVPDRRPESAGTRLTDTNNDFGADFSQFSAFENVEDDDFGEFADVTAVSTAPPMVSNSSADAVIDDDDDDFGDFSDFSDFQQQPASVVPAVIAEPTAALAIDVQEICARIVPLLNMMFPANEEDANDDDDDDATVDKTIGKSAMVSRVELRGDDITQAVLNVDESLALRHQWLTSTGKAELVQALGIDTGKIWNQSMPRFAANLGFTPLEPMKPTAATILRPTQAVRATQPPPIDVPAAQFDWSGAGLVNPLDGVQEILHEAGHPQNRPPRPDADWTLHRSSGPNAVIATPDVPLGGTTYHHHHHHHHHQHPSLPSSAIIIPAATASSSVTAAAAAEPMSATRVLPGLAGGLKETHIFTPSKARTVSSSSGSCGGVGGGSGGGDTDVIVIDETVVTKEYRDVEYNPQSSLSSSYETAQPVVACLQPTNASVRIEWPEPGRVSGAQLGVFEAFDGCQDVMVPSAVPVPATQQPAENFDEFLGGADAFDEFSDFQYVPLPLPLTVQQQRQQQVQHVQQKPVVAAALMPQVPTSGVLVPQPLSILQPQSMIVQPIIAAVARVNGSENTWSDAGIDPDEMARLEAMYPTPKASAATAAAATTTTATTSVQPSPVRSHGSPARSSDDVEWSDFVSSDAGCQPITHIINQNILKHQAQAQLQQQRQSPDEDDWTDFISGGSATNTTNVNASLQAGPNFQSWHANNAQTTFGGGSNVWQTPIGTATPTFLPVAPAMSASVSSPVKYPSSAANGRPGAVNNGTTAAASPLDAHFFKPKPSISLIPDLAGLVFGRGVNAQQQQQQKPSSANAAMRK